MSRVDRVSGATVALARQLHAGGWDCAAIARRLTDEGTPVARSTVYYWTHPDKDAAHVAAAGRDSSRRAARLSGGRLGRANHSDEIRLQRMHGLREAGLSFGAIAKAITFDWPDTPVNAQRVRYLLRPA